MSKILATFVRPSRIVLPGIALAAWMLVSLATPPNLISSKMNQHGSSLNPVAAPIGFSTEGQQENDQPAESETIDGEAIYRKQCASCHGAKGEGVKGHYAHPLRGALSIEKLAELIDETMPEDEPETCSGPEAKAVAKYIHERFYTGKNRTARIQLVRLTENQFRQSVADLVGSFRGQVTLDQIAKDQEKGLQAAYFHARNFNQKKLAKRRVDGQVDFDFGSKLPDVIPPPKEPQKKKNNLEFDANEFSIRWKGSLLVERTGTYEFIVKSQNGFRLFLNDYRVPAINQWVTSGEKEHRVRMHLLGGRAYPLQLDFFRFKDKTSSIQLCWKPPHQSEGLIPRSVLTTRQVPTVGLVKTSFPPDDSSEGYRRGTSVSERWDEAVTMAAIEVADQMVLHNRWLFQKKPHTDAQLRRLKLQCLQFVERAFSAKLNDKEKAFYVEQFFAEAIKPVDSLRRVVILTIKSPRFLYANLPRLSNDRKREAEIIRRIAHFLYDSIPNQQLNEWSRQGKFETEAQVGEAIERLLNDVRSRQKMVDFFEYWLAAGEHDAVTKDKERFPDFDEQVASDLWVSLDRFVQTEFWSEKSDYRNLFLADYIYLNNRLESFYQSGKSEVESDSGPDDSFDRVSFDPKQRAGILTHPYLMMQLSYHRNTSPIHRGVFVARSLMGQSLPPPPNDVDPLSEEFNPKMTTRQRVEFQTREVACMNCHSVINPLGFSLENFDAVGRFRTSEKEKPIDANATLELPNGKTVKFSGPRQLAEYLVDNDRAQKSFIRHLFQHLIKQPVEGYGTHQLDELHRSFVENEFNMKKLVVDIVKVATLHGLSNQDLELKE